MPILPRVRSFWKTLVRSDQLDRELDAELRAAVETITRREVERGADPQPAWQVALQSLGSLERLKEHVRDVCIGGASSRYSGRSAPTDAGSSGVSSTKGSASG